MERDRTRKRDTRRQLDISVRVIIGTSQYLYVYDLSNGLASRLSLQLTGRQIDGIWHTSVVVFGREVFYGQGIMTSAPARSHHGQPMKILDMGGTDIDEETFEDYLTEMRQHYTADKYHLLDFNCNSFTNDCIGFLTGGSIPSWIKDLPSDFLSTPFGASLRPTIDAMYRRPTSGALQPQPDALASSLVQAVSARAGGAPAPVPNNTATPVANGTGSPATATLAAPLQISTNPSSFRSILNSHRVTIAFFTSSTCGPCHVVAPVFEDLSREKTVGRREGDVAFIKIDLHVGMGELVAREYDVRATPTFLFFLRGERRGEVKGANARELKSQTEMMLFEAFPPHEHTKLSLPAIEAVSLKPILFTQVPALDVVQSKLTSTILSASLPSAQATTSALSNTLIPWLKNDRLAPAPAAEWSKVASELVSGMPLDSLFPFLDLWRLAVLDLSVASATVAPLLALVSKLDESSAVARPTLLTALRLLANAPARTTVRGSVGLLVQTLLHADRLVRVAAASAAFNFAAWVQRGRIAKVRGSKDEDGATEAEDDAEMEVELVSAIVQAIGDEGESEDVFHRLLATLAMLIRLSPQWEDGLKPLLEVLQTRTIILEKLGSGRKLQVKKKEVRELATEIAEKLCS